MRCSCNSMLPLYRPRVHTPSSFFSISGFHPTWVWRHGPGRVGYFLEEGVVLALLRTLPWLNQCSARLLEGGLLRWSLVWVWNFPLSMWVNTQPENAAFTIIQNWLLPRSKHNALSAPSITWLFTPEIRVFMRAPLFVSYSEAMSSSDINYL